MKYCSCCNQKYENGNFCMTCGSPLADEHNEPTECPMCGNKIAAGTKFCTECGYRVQNLLLCPKCGISINPNEKFCRNCGCNLSIIFNDNNDSQNSTMSTSKLPQHPETLKIKGTEQIPTIILDREKGEFEFSGRSIPEDATKFYLPILNWIDEYSKSPLDKTVFTFKMGYFNTTTSKIILGIVQKLDKIKKNGSEVSLKWYYHEEDEEMEEFGEVLQELVNVTFEMIPTEEEY